MKTSIHLCFVVTSSVTATTFLSGYLRFLRENGWKVTLICAPGPGLERLSETEGVQICTIPMRREPSLIGDALSLFRLSLLLRQLRPNVLIYATPKASFLSSVAGFLMKIPVRIYEHWGLRLETTDGIKRRVYELIERLTIKLSSHVVANSHSLAAKLKDLKLDSQRPIHVLGQGSSHGVDVGYFSSSNNCGELDPSTQAFIKNHPNELTLGFIGRINPDKGIDTLIDALSICVDRGVPIKLIVVGDSDGFDLHSRLSNLNTGFYIHFVGHVEDTRPYLNALDLLVLMSKREGFPNVVLEAAAMSKPAVVADSTGTIDSVVQGHTGIVVQTHGVSELAEVITKLQRDRSYLELLGSNARARVVAEFEQQMVWNLHSDFFMHAWLLEKPHDRPV